jgi:3-oxoadipate enol-lactonase
VTLLYLHPIGLDGHVWDSVAMDGGLTPSFPGFGGTAQLDQPPSFDAMVEFVAAQLDGPADIVGCSLGSMVAQHVAVKRPGLVRSLVLACGAGRTNAEAARQRAAAARAGGMETVLPSTLERWLTPEARADPGHPAVAYARDRLLRDDPEVFASYWDFMAGHDMMDALNRIRVPVTVIAGESDQATPVSALADTAARIPGARFEPMPGPHILPLENPAGFRDAVARHLELFGSAAKSS